MLRSVSDQGSAKAPGIRGSAPHAAAASGPLRSIAARTLSLDSSSGGDAPCVEALDYASAMRLLAVVLTDGSCALLQAGESGLLPVEQLQRLHWVCGPGSGALTIRIGALLDIYITAVKRSCWPRFCVLLMPGCQSAPGQFMGLIQQQGGVSLQHTLGNRTASAPQLICASQQAILAQRRIWSDRVDMVVCAGVRAQLLAVGLSNGEVALYKLWNVKGGEPVRIISLADWGFEPETTGSVAELQWSPDNRAIAVISLSLCQPLKMRFPHHVAIKITI